MSVFLLNIAQTSYKSLPVKNVALYASLFFFHHNEHDMFLSHTSSMSHYYLVNLPFHSCCYSSVTNYSTHFTHSTRPALASSSLLCTVHFMADPRCSYSSTFNIAFVILARSPFHSSPSHLYMYFVLSPLALIPFLKPPALGQG